MKAGSTTTAGSPESAKRADQPSGSSPVELPVELEAREREGAVGELPDGVERPGAEDVVAVGARPRRRRRAARAWRRIVTIPST